jgi:hypothetical protein
MIRLTQLLLAAAAAATFAGCGYPETKMEAVGQTQMQTQQGQAPQPESAPPQQQAKEKKTEKTAG